jgi:hypothetical protein
MQSEFVILPLSEFSLECQLVVDMIPLSSSVGENPISKVYRREGPEKLTG